MGGRPRKSAHKEMKETLDTEQGNIEIAAKVPTNLAAEQQWGFEG